MYLTYFIGGVLSVIIFWSITSYFFDFEDDESKIKFQSQRGVCGENEILLKGRNYKKKVLYSS